MSIAPAHNVAPGVNYVFHPHHRNGNVSKSQWTIPQNDELASFTHCLAQHWTIGPNGWGLHLVQGAAHYLGVAQDHVTQVFIAKFVQNQQDWHGYPADPSAKHDRPAAGVLAIWLAAQVLPAAKIRKIGKGQPCKP